MRISFSILFFVLASLYLQCSKGVDVAGGSEIGNPKTIIGHVLYGDNTPVIDASVRLRPENYLADTSGIIDTMLYSRIRNVRTDNDGNFIIDSVDTGRYFIEVNDEKSYAHLYQIELIYDDSVTFRLPACYLRETCRLSGYLKCDYGDVSDLFVRIYGLERIVKTNSDGRYLFNDLPSGYYTVNIPYSKVSQGPWERITEDVSAGQSLHLDTIHLIPYDINFENDSIIIVDILNDLGSTRPFSSAVEISNEVRSIIGVYLNDLGMTEMPGSLFNLSPSVKVIHLEDNNLPTFFIPNGAWTNLEELYLQNNRLTGLTQGLSWLRYIKIVDYSNNDIDEILTPMFDIKSLQVFKINSNKIPFVPSNVGDAEALETFELAYNKLRNLPTSIMDVTTLKSLDVDYNHLVSLSQQLDSWVKQFQPDYLLTQTDP
jgi:hypothetical protein